MTDRPTRSHENQIDIDAPPADVWRALTEGEELARWFAVTAEVEPGEGGRWKVSWDESPVKTYALIGRWEPLRHLGLVHDSTQPGEPVRMAEDFEIEALEGGRTRVRIVASGFSTDAAWDGEFEGTKNGWAVFLRNLRFYLEHQRGKPCKTAGIPWPSTLTREQAFARVFGPGGVLACEGELIVDRSITLSTCWGERLEATIDMARGDAMLGLVIGDMLVRAELVNMNSGLFIHVMLLAWGDARERLGELHGRIAAALAERLPQEAAR